MKGFEKIKGIIIS